MVRIFTSIFFASVLAAFALYEQAVKREYAVARDQWESDGRPPGFIWAGEGSSTFFDLAARNRALRRWAWSTPDWATHDPEAHRLIRNMQRCGLAALASWLVLGWLMLVVGARM